MIDLLGSALRRALAALTLTGALVALLVLSGTLSKVSVVSDGGELVVTKAADPGDAGNTPPTDRARGLEFRGLKRDARCASGWALTIGSSACSHGPDRSPPRVDVTRVRTTSELTNEGSSPATSTSGSIPCYGDGTDGKRVQVVYAHAEDVPDRFAELASWLALWTSVVDATFNNSAAETGGIRHVRWVTDADCRLEIQRVRLTSTGDDSFTATVGELGSIGLERSDRKYLVWTDATVYCGIANMYNDDRPDLGNRNDSGPGYGRIDSGCWGSTRSTEAHELMHLLGGVQFTAPHSTGGAHCTDAYDRMCYVDKQGVTLTYPCTSNTHAKLFDCNHDDYFSTNPPAGSYLATHWNAASSSFLEAVEPPRWSSATPSPSPSPSATPSPTPTESATPEPSPTPTPSPDGSPTSTAAFTGTVGRKTATVYPLTVGSGVLEATLSFDRGPTLTLSVRRADGSIVASGTGASPVSAGTLVAQGSYSLVITGKGNATFQLTVTYAKP